MGFQKRLQNACVCAQVIALGHRLSKNNVIGVLDNPV
jgi:hypothetical protein